MGFMLECSLDAQDCEKYNPRTQDDAVKPANELKLPFTNQSCVWDNRLEGTVGRCGWPGAHCIVDSHGNDNCAGGGDQTTAAAGTPSICQDGYCRGDVGSSCSGQAGCNMGISCSKNDSTGVCGGANAPLMYVNDSGYEQDYCLSGKSFQDDSGSCFCEDGPPMVLPGQTSPASQSKPGLDFPIWAIVVVSVVGALAIIAAVILVWGRQRRKKRRAQDSTSKGFDSSEKLSSQQHGNVEREQSGDLYHSEDRRSWDDDRSPSSHFDPEEASMIMSPATEVSTLAAYGLNQNHMTALLPEIYEDRLPDSDHPVSFTKNVRIAPTIHTWQLSPKPSMSRTMVEDRRAADPQSKPPKSVYPAFIVPLVPQKSRDSHDEDQIPDGLLFKTISRSPGASSSVMYDDKAERRHQSEREEATRNMKEIQVHKKNNSSR
ncbi:hypothetical protein CPB83DRAFT_841572 [Crepidotus variabilis]|uniref:Uncharacterized protein n=1 Tax=Crepidotus variabilis TaxID=179855 RepID=A0A9P6JWQ9_9AGAR|nr:hypothetical protein CPB83DRAFT_841572 [Crepidotus variabilis]